MEKRVFLVVILFFILLSCFSFVLGQNEEKYDYQKTTLDVEIQNIIQSNSGNLRVELMAFPRNTENQISSFEAYPDPEILNDMIKFNFKQFGEVSFLVDSEVISYFYYPNIKSEITLPVEIPSKYLKYTKPTKYSNSDSEKIKLKANELSTGKLYETLFNIANFVYENTEYDESCAGRFERASWVLMNKRGVCAEFSNLFIALCRAAGIPARYISGVVYSNKLNDFQEHAWAEIYNGEKWIPYDITFGQFGWIDSTHVLLQYMEDASDPTVEYYYTGTVSVGKLNIDTSIIEQEMLLSKKTSIELNPIYQYVALDSYVPIEIIIENKEDSYLSIPLMVVTAPEIPEKTSKHVFLEPLEKKKTYLLIHVPDLERCKLGCKSDLVIGTPFNNEATTEIYFSSYYPRVSYEEAMEVMNLESELTTNKDLFLDCDFSPKVLKKGQEIEVSCEVSNKKESFYGNLCFESDCENVFIEAYGEFYKNIKIENSQLFCIYINEGGELKDFDCLSFEIEPAPTVSLEEVNPLKGIFSEITELEMSVKSSRQIKAKLKIFRDNKKIQTFDLDLSQGYNIMKVPLKTWKLRPGDNNLKIIFEVADADENVFEFKEEIIFFVEDVSFIEKIIAYIKGIFYWGF